MVSRSLGPEFGGSIGLMFTISNCVACAMYVVGFCESLITLLKENGITLIDGGLNDFRVLGMGTLVGLLLIAYVGMGLVTKVWIIYFCKFLHCKLPNNSKLNFLHFLTILFD